MMLALSFQQRAFKPLILVMGLTTVMALGYIGYYLLAAPKDNDTAEVVPQSQPMIDGAMRFEEQSFDDVINLVRQRDIFNLKAEAVNPDTPINNAPSGELPANLKVVGIILGAKAQVVIEDVGSSRSYFINEGEPTDGFEIIKVEANQVTLRYQGQSILIPTHAQTQGQAR